MISGDTWKELLCPSIHIKSVMSTNGVWPGRKQNTRTFGPNLKSRWANVPHLPISNSKLVGNPLPAHKTPAPFTTGTGIPTEREAGGMEGGSENICFSQWTHQIHDKTLSESKKIDYSQEQGNRWSASSSYDYSKLLDAIQTRRGRWLNAVSCVALVSLCLI